MSEQVKKDIKYLNKDFGAFRQNLIDFAKNYYPNTYNDFNESDPGMMFIEMASYVGDILSYYGDDNLKESLFNHSTERANVLAHALSRGYKTKNVVSARTDLDVYHLIPAVGSGDDVRPDFRYALTVNENLVVRSEDDPEIEFRTVSPVDFNFSSSFDPTEIKVHSTDAISKEPLYYLLKKTVPAISGKIKTTTFTFDSPKIYDKIILNDINIIEVLDVYDSEEERWYETPYLAQETIFEPMANIAANDPELSQYRDSVPYLLKLRKTAKRFVTRYRSDDQLELNFGSGISADADEEIIPNPDNVGSNLISLASNLDTSIDPSNFLYTKTYGLAPNNTTLTIRYTVGDGVKSNVPSNVLKDIVEVTFGEEDITLNQVLLKSAKASIAVTNPVPAKGGRLKETNDEIKNNAMSFFGAQNRMVTKEDFMVRAYSMPSRFGSVAKAFIVPDDQLSSVYPGERIPNPLAMNMYTLGYNSQGHLVPLNPAIKENLKRYLSEYRILTDAINIKDAFIINIGIDFEVIIFPDYNANEVLLKCVSKIKSLFQSNKWQIGQPIIESKVQVELDKIEGVQNVPSVTFKNLYDTNLEYSGNVYDLNEARKDGIIYPSLDPSIFEVKFPNKDIRGKSVTY